MSTIWMMEDEAWLRAVSDYYNEARGQIDATVPRGEAQSRWIEEQGPEWFGHWLSGHQTLEWLRRELDDEVLL